MKCNSLKLFWKLLISSYIYIYKKKKKAKELDYLRFIN